MLLEVSLDPVSLITESLLVTLLSFLAIILLLLLEALLLSPKPLVEIILDCLLSCQGLILHPTLHLLQLE